MPNHGTGAQDDKAIVRNNPLIGRKLANFQIKRLLGHGGMADVYYGWDEKLHRPVAIKVFEAETRAKTAQANRFIQEARMMAKWRHDNIIQIYYSGDETGLFYYVMEFVDGYDLASIMSVYSDKDELMPIADVLRIGDSLASALDYSHVQGVIHRDVKPANVMIANEDGRVVLGDFGLALDLSKKSQGEVFGSPHYIAPEQARRSSDAIPQSDLYSLGVILYEMLTGATPFNDPSPASLALQHISEPPPLPRSINPALSEEVEKVLLKALEKSPADRYRSGRELMDALGKALAAKPAAVPADVSSLPPIPVNVPTIQRSNVSLNSFTKREDVITALEERTTLRLGLVDEDLVPKRTSKGWFVWATLLALLFLLALAWILRPELFSALLPPSVVTSTAAPIETQQVPPFVPPTSSPSSTPTFTLTIPPPTATATNTATATPSPTATQTQIATVTLTTEPTVSATANASPTSATSVASPSGYLMIAHYNQSSFYLHNKGDASRSLSGFTFERINTDGTFHNHFEGWEWETYYVNTIQSNRCVSFEIPGAEIPHLNPPECDTRTLSILNFSANNDKIFWMPNEISREFRVLWLNEEIARCSIEAGTCEFYVP